MGKVVEFPLVEHIKITETEGGIETEKCSVCGEIFKQTNTATGAVYPIEVNAEIFPDEKFRQYAEAFDLDGDGKLSLEESRAVTKINVGGTAEADGGITSLKGIELFTDLESLDCGYNSGLKELNVSRNTALTVLRCYNTQIGTLDVSRNTALTNLNCGNTQISALDVSKNTALTILSCGNTQISALDISQNTALKELYCFNTPLSALNVSKNTALRVLSCDNTQISALDVSQNTALIWLECSNTKIGSLDVTNNTALEELRCDNTQVPCIDISSCEALSTFSSKNCTHSITVTGGEFDTADIPGFDKSRVSSLSGGIWNAVTGVISGIAEGSEITYTYDCDGKGGRNETFTLIPDDNSTFEPEGIEINAANFPDAVFIKYVKDNFDKNSNGYLTAAECDAVTEIDVSGAYSSDGGITSLAGIENFTRLKTLCCHFNSGLTALDVSKNTELTKLQCYNTGISALDVSKNTALTFLWCSDTPISVLDVTQNTALALLNCSNTQISELNVTQNTALENLWFNETPIAKIDVSKNTALRELFCFRGEITELDVSKNTALETLNCHMSKLAYADVSNLTTSLLAMDNKHPIIVTDGTFNLTDISGIELSRISNLRGCDWDTVTGFMYNIKEGASITYTYDCDGKGGSNETFTLVPDNNSTFAPEGIEINAENFPDEVFMTYVGQFDTDSDGILTQSERDKVTSINLNGSETADKGVTSLEGVEYFTKLSSLQCNFNSGLTKLDVSKNTALNTLYCEHTQITALDITKNTALKHLGCSFTQITELDVSKNTVLITLYCCDTQITALDVSNNTELTMLNCSNTKITELDVSNNAALKYLYCGDSKLAFIDVSNNSSLTNLSAAGNVHTITVTDGTFDLKSIEGFDISRIVSGTLSGAVMDENGVLTGIIEGTNITYTYDCKGAGDSNYQTVFMLVPDEGSTFAPVDVEINEANFPDAVFRTYLTQFDTDSDGILSPAERDKVTEINVGGNSTADVGITSLAGIEYFTKLNKLSCCYNSGLTELDVSRNTALTYLNCSSTQISALDVSRNTALTNLNFSSTQITALDVSNNTALTELRCNNTQITSLDVSRNTALTNLNCSSTQITALDVSNNTALTELRCNNTQITALDVNRNTALINLSCSDTRITALDVSQNTALTTLNCFNTRIGSLDVSNNTVLETLHCNNTQITALDVSRNAALQSLWCNDTSITALDVSQNTALQSLWCNNTQIPYVDISGCTALSTLNCFDNAYSITVTDGTFDLSSIEGFDTSRIIAGSLNGAVMDENGVLTGITRGTNITYTYDCDGKGGHNETFTLVPQAPSTESLSESDGGKAGGIPGAAAGAMAVAIPAAGIAALYVLDKKKKP